MRLIDADALGNRMYHESFEKDSDLQRWDSGCWIRYKLFEQVLRAAPTIDPTHTTPSNTLGALDCVGRRLVSYKLTDLVNEFEEILSHIREREENDSVCGLCEYDGAYMGQSGDWCNECPGFDKADCFKLKDKYKKEWLELMNTLPSVQSTTLTEDDKETIRIHLSAFKERLCNQRRWNEAKEYEDLITRILSAPSTQPRKGKWAGKGDSEGFGIFICDNCGKFAMMEYDFCPNCGCRMEEGDSE